jgi:predicted DNA-binding transcriptional regulator AlpA
MVRAVKDGEIRVRPLLSADEVAAVLGIGQRTVWRLASRARVGQGSFPRPIRIGEKTVRWRWKDIERYLEKQARN